jgi:hypothetical protein
MADPELVRGVHHINYEVASFVGALLLNLETVHAPRDMPGAFVAHAVRNGPIELRVLHARNLLELLLYNPTKGEYRAKEYFGDWTAPERAALQELLARACNHMAHLSKERVTDEEQVSGAGDKGWSLATFAPLMRATRTFVERLLASAYVLADAPERQTLTNANQILGALLAQLQQAPPPSVPTGGMRL